MKKLLIIDAAAIAVCGMCFTASAEDGYIESEGGAFICLGHCAGPNTKIEVDLQMTELSFSTYPLGSYGNNKDSDCFEFYVSHGGDEKPRFSFEYSEAGERCAHNCNYATLERYILSYDAHAQLYASTNVTSGGALYTESFADKAPPTETSTYPMGLFGACSKKWASQSGHFVGAVKMKVYGVKIWESGTLVKTFVPCLKGGIPGFKVIVGDDVTHPQNVMFVTGVDISKVKYGGDILRVPDDAHIDLENDINAGTYGKSLYINTGYTVGPATRVELDYALLTGWSSSSKWSVNPCLFSARGMDFWIYGGNDGCYAFTCGNDDSGSNQYYGSNRGDIANISAATAYGIRRTATMNSNSVAIVTAGFTNATKTVATKITANLTKYLKIGARYDNIRYLPIRVYGLKIYENDVLRKNYVPVITNGVPGLVDIEAGNFVKPDTYVSSSITTNRMAVVGGDFDAHTTDIEREAYLEFPATGSGLDTGFKVRHDAVIEADFSQWLANCNGVDQYFLYQGASPYILLSNIAKGYWWKFDNATGGTKTSTGHTACSPSNERRQFVVDGPNHTLTIKRGDTTLAIWEESGFSATTTSGSSTLVIGNKNSAMRLYRLKVREAGSSEPVRDYVPWVTNGIAGLYDLCTGTFKPLTGGKVSGKGYRGQVDECITVPQPARLVSSGTGSTATLTCFAPSAQSYEWYEDGVLMPGETSESLTLNWERSKAKMDNNNHTYSVKPVYTVFNEKVLGEAVAATVEYTSLGTIIHIE